MSNNPSQSAKINILPDHVANKIAAGEVVERPASVVKELMENALDSGATQIDLEITAGGKKLIKVSDNGSGMGRDDALLSIERFATSKIRDVDDIETVATLGFRGEALAAISSVSRFSLKTRLAENLSGTEITMSAGKITEVKDIGHPAGTSIEVRNLFFNVPARLKFLRTPETELAHIKHVFMLYAMANPASGMSLTADGRKIYAHASGADLKTRLNSMFRASELMELKELAFSSGVTKITGYAALPSYSRTDRSEQFVFINGRPAMAAVVHNAIRESYHTLLPRGRFPAIFMFISISPDMVDVNVHPAKKEVRFRNSGAVRDSIIEAITKALSTGGARMPPQFQPDAGPQEADRGLSMFPQNSFPRFEAGVRATFTNQAPLPGAPARVEPAHANVPAAPDNDKPAMASFRVLGIAGGLYVILETEDGVVVMDPHAAHERVLFEQYMRQAAKTNPASQQLLVPETIELSPKDALSLKKHIDLLKKMGFGINEFGEHAFMVESIPACVANADVRQMISDILFELNSSGARGASRMEEDSIASAACKAAVKAHGRMSLSELETLVIDLMKTEMPYTCPHGRPTLIHTSFQELHRKFGRT